MTVLDNTLRPSDQHMHDEYLVFIDEQNLVGIDAVVSDVRYLPLIK